MSATMKKRREVAKERPEEAEVESHSACQTGDDQLAEAALGLIDSIYSRLHTAKIPPATKNAFEVALLEYRDSHQNAHVEGLSADDWIKVKNLRAKQIEVILRSVERILQHKARQTIADMNLVVAIERMDRNLAAKTTGVIENKVIERKHLEHIRKALEEANDNA